MKKVSALAVLEFDNIPTGVFAVDTILKKAPIAFMRAVEAALKGTPVQLLEVRLSDAGLSGKGVALLAGSLPDVDAAAVLAAAGAGADAPPPIGFSFRLIPAPHDVTERSIAGATRFNEAPFV